MDCMIQNEILRQLAERKSVRAFEDRPIAPQDREAILWAACQAPTAGNQQLYTILDVTDPDRKARLAESCDHQPFIAKAPMVLVFCADPLKWRDAYLAAGCTPRDNGAGDMLLAVIDAAIAAQNAVTAAWSLGIGSCYIGDILENRELQRDILGLPEQVVPAVMLVFGHPTGGQRARRKPERAGMEYIVHENGYRRLDADALRAMLAPRCGEQGFDTWVRAFCQRKFNSAFSREMTRSVEGYLSQFRPGTQAGELWDLYTREGQPTGETGVRGEALPAGRYHMVCETLLRHADGTVLVMQRHPEKPLHPGRWEATAGGSALAGEDAPACARRELLEETGIEGRNFREVERIVDDACQCLYHCFIAETDADKSAVTLQEGETVSFRWLSEEELRKADESGEVLSTAITRWYTGRSQQAAGATQ